VCNTLGTAPSSTLRKGSRLRGSRDFTRTLSSQSFDTPTILWRVSGENCYISFQSGPQTDPPGVPHSFRLRPAPTGNDTICHTPTRTLGSWARACDLYKFSKIDGPRVAKKSGCAILLTTVSSKRRSQTTNFFPPHSQPKNWIDLNQMRSFFCSFQVISPCL